MLFPKDHQLQVLLTGGPRSGTSFLAKLVTEMGFHPGSAKHVKLNRESNQKGYLEHLQLLQISREILGKLDADFHRQLPVLTEYWTNDFQSEKKAIQKIVRKDKIDFYKGNRLLILSDF